MIMYLMICVVYVPVPPDHPTIFDDKRRDRTKTKLPWNEGNDVVLTCEVPGGEFSIKVG